MPSINIDFVQDLLRGLRLNDRLPGAWAEALGEAWSGGADQPRRRLAECCARLMGPAGEASRIAAAAAALEAYDQLGPEGKASFFRSLLTDYGPDVAALREAYAGWEAALAAEAASAPQPSAPQAATSPEAAQTAPPPAAQAAPQAAAGEAPTAIPASAGPAPEPTRTMPAPAASALSSHAAFARLFGAAEPRRQALLRALNLCPGATIALVRMREDLLAATRADPSLAPLDVDFAHLFASWFNRGFLVLREIDWNTPAAILEKIVAYEAVHEIPDWDALRLRLDPPDRRCFAFFHPATGDEPLVFVEVALTRGVPDAIAPILSGGGAFDPREADTAAFYSISNCQGGLKGVTFGSFLIKQVVAELMRELPNLKTFVTLSPVPGLGGWLKREAEQGGAMAELRDLLASGAWRTDETVRKALIPRMERAAARYLLEATRPDGKPLDPVARFHLGNGAALADVHWPADLSESGLARGCGAMVNYRYDLDRIEARHEAYAREGVAAAAAAASPPVRRLLKAPDRAA